MTRRLLPALGFALASLALLLPGLAADPATPASAPAATSSAPAPAEGQLPFVHVDREAGYVELDAKVVTRKADWLELLACTPSSREYESIVAVSARPSHVHLALVLLGLTPGHPLLVEKADEGFKVTAPAGPAVAVSFILEEDGKTREVPAAQWVLNRQTQKPLEDSLWLFAGSKFQKYEDKEFYAADLSGSVISLVNFGDDVLTRNTTLTNQSDEASWIPNTEAIPPVGTPLRIRLKPVKNAAAPATQPAGK